MNNAANLACNLASFFQFFVEALVCKLVNMLRVNLELNKMGNFTVYYISLLLLFELRN